jgi:hypothetical protein
MRSGIFHLQWHRTRYRSVTDSLENGKKYEEVKTSKRASWRAKDRKATRITRPIAARAQNLGGLIPSGCLKSFNTVVGRWVHPAFESRLVHLFPSKDACLKPQVKYSLRRDNSRGDEITGRAAVLVGKNGIPSRPFSSMNERSFQGFKVCYANPLNS